MVPPRSLLIVQRNSLVPTFEDAVVGDDDNRDNEEDSGLDEIDKTYR